MGNSDGVNGKPIMAERLGLPRREEGKIGLIIRIDACHQFDIRAIVVTQAAVPCISEFVITPRPLLLSWSDMMVRHKD